MDLHGLRELNGLTKNKKHLNTTRTVLLKHLHLERTVCNTEMLFSNIESVSTIIFALVPFFFSQYIRLSFAVPALFIILFAHAHAKKCLIHLQTKMLNASDCFLVDLTLFSISRSF